LSLDSRATRRAIGSACASAPKSIPTSPCSHAGMGTLSKMSGTTRLRRSIRSSVLATLASSVVKPLDA
jgi:hypothetical protein